MGNFAATRVTRILPQLPPSLCPPRRFSGFVLLFPRAGARFRETLRTTCKRGEPGPGLPPSPGAARPAPRLRRPLVRSTWLSGGPGARPPPQGERSRGCHPGRAAGPRPGRPSRSGIVFPGSRGTSGEGGRPAPQKAASACPPLICISKANFCRTSPAAAAAPTGFARVVVMLQLLLRALLAFQRRIVRGGVRELREPPGAAG